MIQRPCVSPDNLVTVVWSAGQLTGIFFGPPPADNEPTVPVCLHRLSTIRCAGCLAFACFVRAAAAPGEADRWENLRTHPPFGDVALAPAAADWELRGWVVEGSEILFNFLDVARSRSFWVPLGSTANELMVESWAAGENTAVLVHQGRRRTLRLKQAAVVARLPGPDAALERPERSETERVAEIRRRRLAWEQAARAHSR